jgi:3-isopropylmalate/(R)-2-methylmalate dehydratase small subunit
VTVTDDLTIARVTGRALPMRGDDLDTDRILPARFLRAVTFEGLERAVFVDDRQQAAQAGVTHPFSNAAYAGATILLVNANFGCGSSREHAPQGLYRWGIRAVVGESFSEIFFGNSVALGLPCLQVERTAIERLMALIESAPQMAVTVDLKTLSVRAGDVDVPARLASAARDAFLTGRWDATALLRAGEEEVRAVAAQLPYVRNFVPQS